MSKNIKIALFLILLLLFIFILSIVFHKEEKVADQELPWSESEMSFSRVSFFNTQKHRASLAVPDFWEGKYRIKDEGDTVVFLNIDKPEEPRELFRVKSVAISSFKSEDYENWKELKQQDDMKFIYSLSTDVRNDIKEEESFFKMLSNVEQLMMSFKVN